MQLIAMNKRSGRFATLACTALPVLLLMLCASSNAQAQIPVNMIGDITSPLADRILKHVVPAPLSGNSPILLEGATLSNLNGAQEQSVRATYMAGYTLVLLDPTMQHIKALHQLVGEGVTYRSLSDGTLHMYALRRTNNIPTAVLLHTIQDFTGVGAEDAATGSMLLDQAAERTLSELAQAPKLSAPAPRKPDQSAFWPDDAIQTTTLAQNNSGGVYNTQFNVFALHRCLDNTDHYVVTALADWTATNAQFQSAGTEDSSMTNDPQENNLVINWENNGQDEATKFCGAPTWDPFAGAQHICRYIDYPLDYVLTMTPPATGQVIQLNATPAATQGQASSYSSGFSFNIGGTVNVSGNGPQGGISAGASWSNTVSTTVPPLELAVGNTGNEGAYWVFQYCDGGDEQGKPPGTGACTYHVQVAGGCGIRLGDQTGTNPQQGQTPTGKFSNAVQSIHWQQPTTSRSGNAFDIQVSFSVSLATTTAHLSGEFWQVDPNPGCNVFNCNCISQTDWTYPTSSVTFEVPYPSTKCQ
jgi:hypothetical protein